MAIPGDDTALIVPVRLPIPLETLRQRAVPDARLGLPAHATLLFPFAPPETLDDDLRACVARIVSGHDAFSFRLTEQGQWRDTLFAAVEPELPFRSLHDDLAMAFPAFPLHRGAFGFVPHVTIAGGPSAGAPAIVHHPAWASLPAALVASFVDLIVRDADGWRVWSRFDLHGAGRGG